MTYANDPRTIEVDGRGRVLLVYDTEGVRTRRVAAFLLDFLGILLLSGLFAAFVLVFGLLTLGLGWMLFGAVVPVAAILYTGLGFSGGRGTAGMRAAGLRVTLEDGRQPTFLHGAAHVVLFYLTVSFLTPLVLAVTFFAPNKRLLHDMLTGVTIENDRPLVRWR